MIYLDNAATTFPKPDTVVNAINDFLKNDGGNPGRSGHLLSRKSSEKIYECREMMCKYLGMANPERIIFTKNTTEAINLAIKGIIKSGDEIILSSMEHNSVLRSCIKAEQKGATVKIAKAHPDGHIESSDIISLITDKTKLICIIHASNVIGTLNPVREITKEARKRGVFTLVDAAQTAGIVEVDTQCGDLIAFAGHKALYGPFGTGMLYVSEGITLDTLIEGGTGSLSESAFMPTVLPDRFEAGTLNACGIAGLLEGIKFVMREGVSEKEKELSLFMKEQFSSIKGVKLIGNSAIALSGLSIKEHDCVEISARLDNEFEIATRAGLHCAPMAHRTLGTISSGLLRISAGYFNTKDDISRTAYAIESIITNKKM